MNLGGHSLSVLNSAQKATPVTLPCGPLVPGFLFHQNLYVKKVPEQASKRELRVSPAILPCPTAQKKFTGAANSQCHRIMWRWVNEDLEIVGIGLPLAASRRPSGLTLAARGWEVTRSGSCPLLFLPRHLESPTGISPHPEDNQRTSKHDGFLTPHT